MPGNNPGSVVVKSNVKLARLLLMRQRPGFDPPWNQSSWSDDHLGRVLLGINLLLFLPFKKKPNKEMEFHRTGTMHSIKIVESCSPPQNNIYNIKTVIGNKCFTEWLMFRNKDTGHTHALLIVISKFQIFGHDDQR